MNLLQKAILATIAYYDTFNYPLTSFEIFKYLINPFHIASFYSQPSKKYLSTRSVELDRFSKISLINVRKNLETRELMKFIQEENGFYFLKKRKEIVRIRINRQKIADQKWKKAKKIIRWLQIIPYVRMVMVSGSMTLNNTREKSDIDVLIVAKSGRIWLTRFLVTGFLQLIGRRRHDKKTKDRICLNHYITNESLGIKFHSLYNAQTYAHLIPVLELNPGIFNNFQRANKWIKDYLVFWPSFVSIRESGNKQFKSLKTNSFLIALANTGEFCLNNWLGNLLDKCLGKLQKKMIEKDPLTYQEGGRVTIDNTQLEFHPNSPERKALDKYNHIMVELGVSELGHEKDSGLF